MRKFCLCLLSVMLALVLCACYTTYKPVTYTEEVYQPTTFTVYVSGAVENDGYYEITEGTDYITLYEMAGTFAETYFNGNISLAIPVTIKMVVANYYADGEKHNSININGDKVLNGKIDGISIEALTAIRNYRNEVGIIHNKQTLREIIGDEYDNCGYMFFVAEKDYEAPD